MVVSFGVNPKVAGANSAMVNKSKKNSQAPNIRTTKQGNPYYHTNAGKKIGIGIGAAMTLLSTGIMAYTTKRISRIPLTPIVNGLVLGAVFDGVSNHNEKRKADQMKSYMA